MTRAWMSDEGALDLLKRGLVVQAQVAVELLVAGHWVRTDVEVLPLAGRDQQTHDRFREDIDVDVGGGHGLEVKERALDFTGPSDWPYPSIMVGKVSRWRTRSSVPCAIVVVSRRTGGRLVVPWSSRSAWETVEAFDTVERRMEVSYAAPKSAAWSWDELLAHLGRTCPLSEPPF